MTWTRRALLGTLAASGACLAMPARARARSGARTPRLVVVILRGGVDGLHAVPPTGDPHYRSARAGLAVDDALALDATFGLHPALAPIHPWFAERDLLLVQATGTTYRGRSHFDAQDQLENGTDSPRGASTGWLGRALGTTAIIPTAIGARVPLLLRGAPQATAVDPTGLGLRSADLAEQLEALYLDDPLLHGALTRGIAAREAAGATTMSPTRGASPFAPTAAAVARILAAEDGPTVATLDLGGWDSHARQDGTISARLGGLADGLVALREGLGEVWQHTAVLVVSEFGRTVASNGTGGTDHGTGGIAMLVGGAIHGGRVIADWPGLAMKDRLDQRDLRPTTPLRGIVAGLLHDHLQIPSAHLRDVVFPAGPARVRDLIG